MIASIPGPRRGTAVLLLATALTSALAPQLRAADAVADGTAADETQTASSDDSGKTRLVTQDGSSYVLDTIVVDTAAQQLLQQPGVSTVTAAQIDEQAPTNDIMEVLAKQPGVNLTGNSNSGQRGNNRQIDLRGMGPENTLILIDGRPVLSRNSVHMARGGERDTRGDSNWVPAEAIDHIEVIRGPAAARYGSGAAGGVVNIITKRPDKKQTTVSGYFEQPEHGKEGANWRTDAVSSGPLTDRSSYRVYLSRNHTDADDPDINAKHTAEGASVAAGQEGVDNVDFDGLIEWRPDDMNTWGVDVGYSDQSNIYAGDSLLQGTSYNDYMEKYYGKKTNEMKRYTLAFTHKGSYDFGTSNSYLQWEHTENRRLGEGTAGGVEGSINSDDWNRILLDTVTGKTEWNLPGRAFGVNQTVTLGAEYRGEFMKNPVSVSQSVGLTEAEAEALGLDYDVDSRKTFTQMHTIGLYAEDNMLLTDKLTLTPGFREDWNSDAGFNASPSLNATYQLTPDIALKGGVSRAFKMPNLMQLNPDYVYRTRGNGCPDGISASAGCYILGNEDLKPETSWNKEIGISYTNLSGWNAGLTYFQNDYHNKITASTDGTFTSSGAWVGRWDNVTSAVIKGLEANLRVPVHSNLNWWTNGTVMLESKNKETGDPLSLVPDYTINSGLDWQISKPWKANLVVTHYGKTPAPSVSNATLKSTASQEDLDPYTVVNLTTTYTFASGLEVQGGIKNLFDEAVFREGTGNNAGANTYNIPGRSFLVKVSYTF